MNWEDERYVRLYVRDTDEWLSLSWTAQGLMPMLLRKANRSGVIEAKRGPASIANIIRWPLEVVEPALTELVADGMLVQTPAGYVFRNFVEAQESTKSNALRSREKRERARARALGDDTERVEHDTGRVATDTERHSATQGDTPYRAVPCSASPARVALEDRARAIAEAAVRAINAMTGKRYQPGTESVMRDCRKLAKANITPEQAVAAVEHVGRPWVTDPRFRDKVRPATLLQLARVQAALDDIAAGNASTGQRQAAPSVPLSIAFDDGTNAEPEDDGTAWRPS